MNDFLAYCTAHPLSLPHPHQSLNSAECDELFELLESAALPASAMPAEMADGYLTACVISPVPVHAHEWLQAIFGQSTLPICTDDSQQERLISLLRRRERDIALATAMAPQALTQEKLFLPLIGQVADAERITPYQLDEDGERLGDWACKDWARGFSLAMQDHPQSWLSLAEKPQNAQMLAPVVLFSHGYNPDQPAQQIDEHKLGIMLPLCIYAIRDFWHARKNAPAAARHLRDDGKVGRNDPCPCGSGKKYKKCCGA
jgi:uncharacterized protein